MTMSRKDYKTIAKVLHERRTRTTGALLTTLIAEVIDTVASELAAEFETDNRLFNREKFMNYVRTGSERGG